jgi:predicted nucleic acid-binding protein
MKYVLDSCVAAKWLLPEVDRPKALLLRDDFKTAVHELIAPDILPVECAHALTHAERQRRITPAQSGALLLDLFNTLPLLHPYLALLGRAHDISSATKQGVYDCLYVALAEREQCELITSDDKLIKNLGTTFPFIISLASFP